MTGTVGVNATETTSQYASSTGVVVGILALGADLSLAESNTTTLAYLNNQVAVSGTTLAIDATGQDTNFAYALSGSGGVVAGSAATVTTSSISDTEAYTGAGTTTQMINVTNLNIQASHDAVFNGEVDSTNAAIAGMSAANAVNTVDSTVVAQIGANEDVYANNIAISATNTVDKDWLLTPAEISEANADAGNGNGPDYAGVADWNVNSGSGGLINLPAGASVTTITANTTAAVGANANVAVGVTLLPDATPALGTFKMDARNNITAHDKVELDSGGALAFAEAQSSVTVNATATVSFGGGSNVDVRQGDIDAGAMATVDINTLADADTYGLAGAPAGQAYSFYTGTNQVLVEPLATLTAETGGINLYGGDSSSGTSTTINAVSAVNLWNKTAIPIATTPDAETSVSNTAGVDIQGPPITYTSADVEVPGTALMSAGDINLTADRGTVSATATGIGKNIYLEALSEAASDISELFGGSAVSFDITGGSSNVTGTGTVQVDGTVETGLRRNVTLELDGVLDGTSATGAPLWYLVTSTGSTLAIDLTKDVQYRDQHRSEHLQPHQLPAEPGQPVRRHGARRRRQCGDRLPHPGTAQPGPRGLRQRQPGPGHRRHRRHQSATGGPDPGERGPGPGFDRECLVQHGQRDRDDSPRHLQRREGHFRQREHRPDLRAGPQHGYPNLDQHLQQFQRDAGPDRRRPATGRER